MYVDSVDKIVRSYFRAVASEPFWYAGERFEPVRLTVSPLLRRGFTCPERCGACCPRFSLEYLPWEERPPGCVPRHVEFNFRKVLLFHDSQEDHRDHYCRNLDRENGRCGIHGRHPFSCDFELIRVLVASDGRSATLTQKLFGRKWAMLRVDGERGALCEMLEPTPETVDDVARKLARLEEWAEHFGLANRIGAIIGWLREGSGEPLVFEP